MTIFLRKTFNTKMLKKCNHSLKRPVIIQDFFSMPMHVPNLHSFIIFPQPFASKNLVGCFHGTVYKKTHYSLTIFITSHFVCDVPRYLEKILWLKCAIKGGQHPIFSLCCEIDAHLNVAIVDWNTFLTCMNL
jgi:hypothetical protein